MKCWKSELILGKLSSIWMKILNDIGCDMTWIEMRFNSNSIEFRFNWILIQIANTWYEIQISLNSMFLIEFNSKFNWIQIQLKRNEMQIDAWGIWKYASHCSVEKISFRKCRSKKHLSVLFGANTKPKSIFVLMKPKLVYSIQAPMLPSSLELRLTACLTSIMYM
jgi:hypothetical protein